MKLLELRLADGERVIGKKIGATSRAVQDMLGVHQPDFGFLTSAMEVLDGESVQIAGRLIQPRAEAEIAFVLRRGLKGPGITPADVLDATDSIAACFEIVDSRIENWKIGIVDTIADNASCGVFVLGAARVDPRPLDLAALGCASTRTGSRSRKAWARRCRVHRWSRWPGSRIRWARMASRSMPAR